MDIGGRLHAQLPDPAGQGPSVPGRPRGPAGAGRRPGQRLSIPTLASGETIESLRAEAFDPEEAAGRGMAFERLDQLALEHLYGVRG